MKSASQFQFTALPRPVGMPAGVVGFELKKLAVKQLTKTARHEAAHGTVAALLEVPLRLIDIRPTASVSPDGRAELSYGVIRYDVDKAHEQFSAEGLLTAVATVAAAGLVAESMVPDAEHGAEDDVRSLMRYAMCLNVDDVGAFVRGREAEATALLNAEGARVWTHLTHALLAKRYLSGAQVVEVVSRARGTRAR